MRRCSYKIYAEWQWMLQPTFFSGFLPYIPVINLHLFIRGGRVPDHNIFVINLKPKYQYPL